MSLGKSLEIYSDDADAWYESARVRLFLGDANGSLQALAKAIENDEDYKENVTQDHEFQPLWENPELKKLLG
jgi:2'-5' RNA ligase